MLTRTVDNNLWGLSETHADVLHAMLFAVECEGFDPGDYDVEATEDVGGWVSYAISESDARTLRAFDRLSRGVIRGNRAAIEKLEDAYENRFENAKDVAFDALLPALASGDDGIYEVCYDEATVEYTLSPRQVATLRAYHQLLFRIYREGGNRDLIDSTVAYLEDDED